MPQTPRAFPVSPGQARLWYLQQLYPGSSTNNLNVVLTRRGPLDAATLRAALAALVARHEPLRTTFQEGPDGPEQVVHEAPGPVPLAEDDLSGLAAEDRAAALRELQLRDARAPFDLSRWPLLRLRLVRLGDDEHALVVVVHHVVVDAASMEILAGDLAELCLAAAAGRPPALPELRIQYVDYVAWQAGRLAGADAAQTVAWWRETLAGVPPLRLMPGRPRPVSLGEGAERPDRWPPEFGRRMAELGGAVRATPFMTVLAGWAALLSRCTGADDFAVGVPMSDRPSDELDRVVGYFVDMVGLRIDLSGDPSFRQLLTRVRDTVIDGFERRSVPFEQVVDAVRPERSPAETPLFQVGLNLVQSAPAVAATARHPDFWSDGQEYGDGSTKYDLFLTLYEQSDGSYGVVVDWRVGLLPDEVAGALPAQLRTLLAAAADAPDTPLSRLPLLSAADEAAPAARLDGPAAGEPGGLAAGVPAGLPGGVPTAAASAGVPARPVPVGVPGGLVLVPWRAPAPGAGVGGAGAGRGDVVVLAGEGWSAGLARSWAATGARVFRSWTPSGGDRPVLGGPWQDVPRASRAPLGRPLPGSRVLVLGPDGRPAPLGLPGQLHVATDGETPRPSGTLVRVLPGGQLEYVGPVDGRVRVGGYPVEPATVEAALLEQPEVAAAAVLVRGGPDGSPAWDGRPEAGPDSARDGGPDGGAARDGGPDGAWHGRLDGGAARGGGPDGGAARDGGPGAARHGGPGDGVRLVAYVRPVPGTRPTGAALRARLVSRLSPAQVPAAIVVLADPPLRPDGTLDTRLLPAARDHEDTAERVPPRTPTERRLAEIWAAVLGRDSVGVTDNFFALGGDSFLCLRVVTAATAAGLPITPVDVFARQTIAGLADGLPAGPVAPAGPEVGAAVLRRLAPRPRLVAELDRPVAPAELAGWPVRVEAGAPGARGRLVGDGALLDDRSWTELLSALATGAELPPPPAALPVPDVPPPGVGGPGLVVGEWSAVRAVAPLDEAAARDALGGTAADLIVAALAAVLPGPHQVVELSDVDRLLAGVEPGRPAGRLARDVRLRLPAGRATVDSGQCVDAVRAAKEVVRAAVGGDGVAEPPTVCVSVLPALPAGVRDVDDGQGPLVAPLEVRVRLPAGSAELVFRGLSASWPPGALRELAVRAAEALRAIGAAVGGLRSRVYTPSDFPAAGLSQDQLDRLLDRLGGG